jgi:hypothetical protein
VLALSASPAGFTASELATRIHSVTGTPVSEYGARRAAYDRFGMRVMDRFATQPDFQLFWILPALSQQSFSFFYGTIDRIVRPFKEGTPPDDRQSAEGSEAFASHVP